MPLVHFIEKPQFTIGIWDIKEHEYNSSFSKVLHPNYHINIANYKSTHRKWQVHATKLLFEHLLPGEELVLYNDKPVIGKSTKYISISHTNNIIAMIVAKFPCGIDIEKSIRDSSKIKHKFLNKNDFTAGESKLNLLKNWCAKEVMYKIKGDKSVIFSNHLIIKKNGNCFSGYCNHPSFKFTTNIKIINFEDYCLAFNTNYKELS